jgi:O-antigen/teichoic acid export membrane protein
MTAAITAVPAGKTVLADGIYTLTGRLVRTLLVLALSVLVARALGPHDRGLYALPTVVYTGFVVSLLGGIADAVSYFMLNSRVGRGAIKPAVITGLLFVAAGALPVTAFAELGHNSWALVPSLIFLPLNVPMMLFIGYATGTKRIRWQTIYYLGLTAALLCAMAAAFTLFARTFAVAVDAFLAANAAVAAVCLAIVLIDAQKLNSREVPLVAFLNFAVRVGAANIVTLLNYRADLYVVALLAAPRVLGQYAVAIGAAETLLVVTQVPAVITSPHVGALAREEAARMTAKCARLTVLVAAVVCGTLYAFAPLLVEIVYGRAYTPLVPALRILLVAVAILSLARPVANYFTLKLGKPEVGLLSAAIAAVLCIAISWILVPRMGMVGAAIATTCAYAAGESIRMALFIRNSKLKLAAIVVPTQRDLVSCFSTAIDLVREHAARFRGFTVPAWTAGRYAALAFVVLTGITLSAYRARQAAPEWSNDGSIYLAMTLHDRGLSYSAAYDASNAFMQTTGQGRAHPQFYSAAPPSFIVQQHDLFRTRPLYPFVASLLPLAAPSALKLVSAISYALVPPLFFLVLLMVAPPWLAALGAVTLAGVPIVYDVGGLALTDEFALLLWIATLGAMLAFAQTGSRRGLAVLFVVMTALVFTRPALHLPLAAAIALALAPRRLRAGRSAAYALICAIVAAAAFLGYMKLVHGAGVVADLQWNYNWQRAIHGPATTHGIVFWLIAGIGRAVALVPKTLLKNLGLFPILLAAIAAVRYRNSPAVPLALGALAGAFLTVTIAPIDVERLITLPAIPPAIILATAALANLLQPARRYSAVQPAPVRQ